MQKLVQTSDGVILDKVTSSKIQRVSRIASFITFFSYPPYTNKGLSDYEHEEINKMFNFEDGYDSTFKHYVGIHHDFFEFVVEFVLYIGIIDSWDHVSDACDSFLKEYYQGNMSGENKEILSIIVEFIEDNKIYLFDLVDFSDERLAGECISKYSALFGKRKNKNPLKSTGFKCYKWAVITGSLLLVAYLMLQN